MKRQVFNYRTLGVVIYKAPNSFVQIMATHEFVHIDTGVIYKGRGFSKGRRAVEAQKIFQKMRDEAINSARYNVANNNVEFVEHPDLRPPQVISTNSKRFVNWRKARLDSDDSDPGWGLSADMDLFDPDEDEEEEIRLNALRDEDDKRYEAIYKEFYTRLLHKRTIKEEFIVMRGNVVEVDPHGV